jgi:hypothetical protein
MEDYSRVSVYSNFVDIARQHWEHAQAHKTKLDTLMKSAGEFTGDGAIVFEQEHITPLVDELDNHCVITIVFCALAVEGYIYDYAARKLSDSFVDAHLDKLDVVSKWVVVPMLATGKEFPKDTKGFQLLKQLVSNRNFLAHNKSAPFLVFDQKSGDFIVGGSAKRLHDFGASLMEKAEAAITALDELAQIMESLDPDEYASFAFSANVGKRKKQFDEYGV